MQLAIPLLAILCAALLLLALDWLEDDRPYDWERDE